VKIATIGAGSVVWGPTINTDFLLNPGLDGAELMLMDVNAETLGLVSRHLERLVAERGFRKTIRATTDLTEALRGADYVLTAISVGGDRVWRYDALFPQVYGVFQPVGDTIGPGGLMRALRHAPALLEVGRRMLDVSKPGAPLIQLTNPMNPLCAALESLDGLTVYGICHGVDDTEAIFAKQLGVPKERVRVEAAGNNHFIFCTEIEVDGELYGQERFAELTPRVFDTPLRAEVFRRYDALVANYSRHPIEFMPGFVALEHEFGRRWGVSPMPSEVDPMRGERQDRARELLEAALAQPEPVAWRAPTDRRWAGLEMDAGGRAEAGHSREIVDDFLVALERRGDFFIHLNLRNEGAIAGVPDEHNVELPVFFERGKLRRKAVRFRNEAVTREVARVGREQHLIARGCVERDVDLLIEALTMDALVPSADVAARLVREMVAYQREYLDPALGR
jgi:alpha-galactosidase